MTFWQQALKFPPSVPKRPSPQALSLSELISRQAFWSLSKRVEEELKIKGFPVYASQPVSRFVASSAFPHWNTYY